VPFPLLKVLPADRPTAGRLASIGGRYHGAPE
jgi:hypothetical protein